MTQCQGFGSANAQPVHHVLLLLLAMLTALPAGAVLPENNIDKTLVSLSADMAALMRNMPADLRRVDSRLQELHATTDELERTLEETAVMLLSQDERYLYGTLQATQGMKDVVRRIRAGRASLRAQERDLVTITARYAALARLLRPGGVGADSVRVSTAAGRRALAASAGRADTLRRALGAPLSAMRSERARYARLCARADSLEAYNNAVLERARAVMFGHVTESLGDVLSHFGTRMREFVADLDWRFNTGQSDLGDWTSRQDRMDRLMDIADRVALALALCLYLLARFTRVLPEWVRRARLWWAVTVWLAANIAGFGIIAAVMGPAPMLRITLMLEAELYVLALLVVASVTVRLGTSRGVGRTIAVAYLPMLALSYFIISNREDLVPLSTVTFSTPFIFMLALAVQAVVMAATRMRRLQATDRRMAVANLVVIALCVADICTGHTVRVTILFLLWIIVVIEILGVLLIMKNAFMARKLRADGVASLTVRALVVPLGVPALALGAVAWVAHIYNLTGWLTELMETPFVDMPDRVGVISVAKLVGVYALGVAVNYGVRLTRMLLHRNPAYRQGQAAVAISVGTIVVWLCYAVAVLLVLEVNRAGILAGVGGASVGIGFALKSTFENLFSGLSLMTGRLRPGDIMEYDGVRGKVLHIGIISTQMETEDGPIMTMPNSQLFEKNFRNMTRNHGVELRHIAFDISSENDPAQVRALILDSFRGIDGVVEREGWRHVVIMRNFGSGIMRVELKVWIESEKYLATEPAVREAVFASFRRHGIRAVSILQQLDARGSDTLMTYPDNNII